MPASIEQRRARATPEREQLLAAQAEATSSERLRRLREFEEQHEPVHELWPFLLHLLAIPCLEIEAVAARGPRRFPLVVHWLVPFAVAIAPRCPACDAPSRLVAGRDHLGCRTIGVRERG